MQGALLDGRYRLVERIGSGGMGQVWAAFDERMRRDVAIKLLSDSIDATDPVIVARFEREARAAGGLSSPHVVTVHDYGEGDLNGRQTLFLVMERLRGQSLSSVLAKGRPDVETALAWGRQICQALEAAHRTGLVHRDIKPANVMVTDEGRVKVLDFGIARFVGETASLTTLTATDSAVGTPAYMSPEQFEGSRDIGAASDLYSFGCLLYALLCGGPPFTGASPYALLRQHLDKQPEPPSRRQSGIPLHLDRLVLDLLHKDPKRRPANAREVARRLDERVLAVHGSEPPVAVATPTVVTSPATAPAATESLAPPPVTGQRSVLRPVVLCTGTTIAGVAASLAALTPLGPNMVVLLSLLTTGVAALATGGLLVGEEHEALTGLTVMALIAGTLGTFSLFGPSAWWVGTLTGLGVLVCGFVLSAVASGVFMDGRDAEVMQFAAPAAGVTNGVMCFALLLTRTDTGLLFASLTGLGVFAGTLAVLGILMAISRR
ncbi:serine/threonine-protein kinase [Streptomyces sp. NPDC049555]|uniref:serine/threonine-protein kinase n=1 Tax=Streptomyces sp. NPDC049555 TaxID=3154930 RepID=UPI00342C299A